MSAQWKPGDVAMFTLDGRDVLMMRGRDGRWTGYATEHDYWINRPFDGKHAQRPVIVIDPEDRDAMVQAAVWAVIPKDVERLHAYRAEQMQVALRSLLAPPKPPEPQGLGAVVRDADGHIWVRIGDGDWWRRPYDGARHRNALWQDIDAPEVLSEGVQP